MKGRTGLNINGNGILLLNLLIGKQGWCHKENTYEQCTGRVSANE